MVVLERVGDDLRVRYCNRSFADWVNVRGVDKAIGASLFRLIGYRAADAPTMGLAKGSLQVDGRDGSRLQLERVQPAPGEPEVWFGSAQSTATDEAEQLSRFPVAGFGPAAHRVPAVLFQARRIRDDGLNFDYVSATTPAIFGVEPEAILEQPGFLESMILVEDLPGFKDALGLLSASGERSHSFRIRDQRGELRRIEMRVAAESGVNSANLIGLMIDVTGGWRDRRATDEQLEDLAGSMPGYLFRMDVGPDGLGQITYLSRGAQDLYGPDVLDMNGSIFERLTDRTIAEDRASFMEARHEAIEKGEPATLERRILDHKGRVRWLQSFLRPRKTGRGFTSVIGATFDVTEQRQAELALIETRARLEDITNAMPGAVYRFVQDADGRRMDFMSAGGRDLWGVEPQAILENYELMRELVYPPDRAAVSEAIAAALRFKRAFTHEFRVVTPQQELKWLRAVAQPAQSGGDRVVYDGMLLDVSDRKFAELALRRSEERYRAVVQAQSDVIFRFDTSGYINFSNTAGVNVFGPVRVAPGLLWQELVVGVDRNKLLGELSSLTKESPDLRRELKAIDCNGNDVWIQWTVTAFFNGEGDTTGFQAVGRDVTQVRALEREVRETVEREQQRIGHDLHDGLGQDLTGISLLLKSLERSATKRSPELLPEITVLNDMVKKSLASARALAQGLSPVHLLRDGLAGALDQLGATVKEVYGAEVVVRYNQRGEVRDSQVATELFRIAQEAVTNAAKHAYGKIEVQLRFADDQVQLRVRDRGGKGRRPEETSGGMGLRIMRYRADLIGAELLIKSRKRAGTEVICRVRSE